MSPDTRRNIVFAAMDLFWMKGFNSTSIADILSRTQIHSGSLYHFFPGKQDVLVAVLEMYRDGIEEMLLAPAWEGVSDPIDKVFALLKGYRGHLLTTDCTYGCPIGSLALELHEPDERVRLLMAENFAGWVRHIENCLIAARARLPEGADTRALAEFVLTTMEGAVMQARTHRDIGYFDRNIACLRAHFDMLMERARPIAVN